MPSSLITLVGFTIMCCGVVLYYCTSDDTTCPWASCARLRAGRYSAVSVGLDDEPVVPTTMELPKMVIDSASTDSAQATRTLDGHYIS